MSSELKRHEEGSMFFIFKRTEMFNVSKKFKLLIKSSSVFSCLYIFILSDLLSVSYIYIYIDTHTNTHIYMYIYTYIYLYICIYICIFWQHFFINTNFVEHNWHFLSTYFLVDPFILPYWFYNIRRELIDVFSIIIYFPSTFCPTLGHHQGR